MAAITSRHLAVGRPSVTAARPWDRPAFIVSGALAAFSAVAAGATFFVPGVLRGTAVMNGSARGTAIVMLVAGVPALLAAMYLAARGSLRARIVWVGIAAYFGYNGVMFVISTPMNQLYLLYEAVLGLSIWSVVLAAAAIDREFLRDSFKKSFPRRALAIYTLVIVALNSFVWLSGAVPATFETAGPKVLAGTGLTTVPTYDQDLAFWLPFIAVAAVWMWRGIEWGRLIVGATLAFWVLEGIGVAVDQWLGSAADPSSTVASATMTPVFIGVALVSLVPLFFYLRSLGEGMRR